MKKVIVQVFVIAFVGFVGYNVYSSQNNENMPSLMLANVEALANNTEQATECSGCNSPWNGICKVFAWGGCLGYRYL
ncbi:NVEALA domain-containing protein [Bacteroides graminisolvens]|uniref:NVEALA domain-containing protein n=1 Tax=Bacteroides graminisolvens TaxID=477666 RepID=UPI0004685AF6|nr:NVEALA domain-containing protein [Bacteroides graminisolvens]